MSADRPTGRVPVASSVLAVCAHPDDESFGLGAVLDRFVAAGTSVSVLCFTHGEASTLGLSAGVLHEVRAAELVVAAAALGVGRVRLLDHPDGALATVPLEQLADQVRSMADQVGAQLLVVFDVGGITGHPDHCRATEAALAGAPDLPALAWSLPRRVADELNDELATGFVGRADHEIDLVVTVDREVQRRAIASHTSQCADNPVLWRRLELLGDREALRWLLPFSGVR
ncbi:MAG TPA: PIG-L deacetylase family protein [Acidimicrobiales bacterium]|nr:PIG-L deacetylase family protein [Acidimicrobiales bacterium]